MSNLVIVAIPNENDYVWKLSSEKIPHMTLLFLGDVLSNPNVLKILEFLEHAVNTLELGPFGLEVDYRGVLGADEADVLFFREDYYSYRNVAEFRGQLLKNEAIRRAYDSTDQFEGWTPHLTMGYPATPAKEDTRDYPGITWVEFDRIALWYGDYEGPEWRLHYKETYPALAMSDLGQEFIEHHGVKGQRWGVRRSSAARADRQDAKWISKHHHLKGNSLWSKSDKAVFTTATNAAKKDLKKINKKPEYAAAKKRGDLKNPDLEITKKYQKEQLDNWVAHLNAAAAKQPMSPTGRLKTVVKVNSSNGNWQVTYSEVKHSELATLEVRPIYDAEGELTDLEEQTNTLEQGTEFVESLMHFGVKGMHWGIRRSLEERKTQVAAKNAERLAPKPVSAASKQTSAGKHRVEVSGGKNHPASRDALKAAEHEQKLKKSGAHALSNQELRDLATRLQLEQQVQQLQGKRPQSKGQEFVNNLLKDPAGAIGTATTIYNTAQRVR